MIKNPRTEYYQNATKINTKYAKYTEWIRRYDTWDTTMTKYNYERLAIPKKELAGRECPYFPGRLGFWGRT